MKHYFQHPKRTDGSLNTSKGKIDFVTDEFNRPGIFAIPHTEETLPVIEALQQLKLKDIGEPTTAEKKEIEKINASQTGTLTFSLPKGFKSPVHTSAGDIPFVNGLATVHGKQADILIALKYPVVNAIKETPQDQSPKILIVPTREEYAIAGYDPEKFDTAFPGLNPGDKYTEEQLDENKKKASEKLQDENKKLTFKQLKLIAKENGIETKDVTEEALTATLKEKNLLPNQ
jgi:hypothetical protein